MTSNLDISLDEISIESKSNLEKNIEDSENINYLINITNNLENNSLENLHISPLNNDTTNSDIEYKTCNICFEDFEDICLLRCDHVLCLKCSVLWFSKKTTCPFCRLNINNLNNLQVNNSTNISKCHKIEKIICYTSLILWPLNIFIYNVM